jgi:hypothetical protein
MRAMMRGATPPGNLPLPDLGAPPLVIDLGEYFREVLGE